MVNGRALFPGDCEIDQIYRIFRVLGTPTECTWPGVTTFNYYKDTFPKWIHNPGELKAKVPFLDANGHNLLAELLCCDPSRRITARDALRHPFFNDLRAYLSEQKGLGRSIMDSFAYLSESSEVAHDLSQPSQPSLEASQTSLPPSLSQTSASHQPVLVAD
jgi:serine/threonine protein kinase